MKEETLKKPAVIVLLALTSCLLWGSAYPSVKIGYELFSVTGAGSQLVFAGCRFSLAGFQLLLLTAFAEKRMPVPKKEALPSVLALSMVQTVIQYLFFYIGMAHADGITGAIISATSVFFAIIFAYLLVREKITPRKVAGCIIGFSGILVMNLAGGTVGSGFRLNGEGFLLVASASYALSSVMVKSVAKKDSPVLISGFQFFVGGLILLAAGLIMGGRLHGFSPAACGLLYYMSLLSAVAYSLWTLLLKYNPVGKITVFSFTTPIFGSVLSSVFLGEKLFTWYNGAALVLVCAGIIAVNKKGGETP